MSISACELGCEYKDHSPEQLFRAMVVQDGDGCNALRAEIATSSETECIQITCEEASLPAEELFKKLLFENSEGCITLRTILV